MAECHPVGFQYVMEAKQRGATIIHVDPRFTRTSAVSDLHVPIRAASDVAFLGGLINHVLTQGLDFREYVLAYTNAAAIVGEDFRDTEDLDGLLRLQPRHRDVRPCLVEVRQRATERAHQGGHRRGHGVQPRRGGRFWRSARASQA